MQEQSVGPAHRVAPMNPRFEAWVIGLVAIICIMRHGVISHIRPHFILGTNIMRADQGRGRRADLQEKLISAHIVSLPVEVFSELFCEIKG